MTRPPASCAPGLSRKSVGLTEPHKNLIRKLAEIAVEDFLRESEATTDEDDREEGER